MKHSKKRNKREIISEATTNYTEVVSKLCEIVSSTRLSKLELLKVLTTFIYSVGSSIEGYTKSLPAEEVLFNYSKNPTLGNALMTQALFMRENWEKSLKELDLIQK